MGKQNAPVRVQTLTTAFGLHSNCDLHASDAQDRVDVVNPKFVASEKRKRVCTHVRQDGAPGTRCGVTLIGVCPDGTPQVANGQEWVEVAHVRLAEAETAPD